MNLQPVRKQPIYKPKKVMRDVTLSVSKGGVRIYFSAAACKKWKISEMKFMEVLCDVDEKIIGLKHVVTRTPSSYSIYHYHETTTALVTCLELKNVIEDLVDGYKEKYKLVYDENKDCFLIDLKSPICSRKAC